MTTEDFFDGSQVIENHNAIMASQILLNNFSELQSDWWI